MLGEAWSFAFKADKLYLAERIHMPEQESKHHRKHMRRVVALIIAVSSLLAYLLNTNPEKANLLMTFIPLLFVWVIVFLLISFSDIVLKRWSSSLIFTLSAVVATVTTFMLMFSALGSVGVFDVGLLFGLACMVVFYIRRTWSK